MKNKILTVFLIVILISFCFIGNSAFAIEVTEEYPDLPVIEGAVDYRYMIAKYNANGNIWLFLFYSTDGTLDLSHDIISNGSWATTNKSSSSVFLKKYYIKNNAWSQIDSSSIGSGSTLEVVYNASTQFTYIKSDFYIYNADGSIFFPVTPLAQILGKVEMTQEITTTIVGLAKLLIPLLACLLGLWKAWQILSKLLHKA